MLTAAQNKCSETQVKNNTEDSDVTGLVLACDNESSVTYNNVKKIESNARTYANSIDKVIVKGLGSYVYDENGKEYLDLLNCAGALALGHNNPFIVSKLQDFLSSNGILQSLDITTPVKEKFLSSLLEFLPPNISKRCKVQFCGPTGSDAAEAAIKLFKTATGRNTILSFSGGYHGMTIGSLSLMGNLMAKTKVTGLMPDVHFLPYPYPYRCPFGLGGEQSWQVSANYIEHLLNDPESGITKPAAIFLEVVQGEGGVIPAPVEWLVRLREITKRLDIPLVIDEIQSGIGRTGDMFSFEESGIEPDAILISKAIGGGLPLSLMVYDEKYDEWEPGSHTGTFRGNQMAMVAGKAILDFFKKNNVTKNVKTKGAYLEKCFKSLALIHPEIGDVRGRGLMWGLEIVDIRQPANNIGSYPSDGELTNIIKKKCLKNGLIIESGGRDGAVLRILPALTISQDELNQMIEILDLSITEAKEGRK